MIQCTSCTRQISVWLNRSLTGLVARMWKKKWKIQSRISKHVEKRSIYTIKLWLFTISVSKEVILMHIPPDMQSMSIRMYSKKSSRVWFGFQIKCKLCTTNQQKRCPFPQSTAGALSNGKLSASEPVVFDPCLVSLTALSQAGVGHHLIEGLFSTKAWKIKEKRKLTFKL